MFVCFFFQLHLMFFFLPSWGDTLLLTQFNTATTSHRSELFNRYFAVRIQLREGRASKSTVARERSTP